MRKKLIWFAMILLILLCIGCKKKEDTTVTKEDTIKENTTEVKEPEVTADAVKEVSHEGMMRSYLTGQWVANEIGTKRPIAFMFNNVKVAVPQSGIDHADIVYEAPVEGGITRLMGVLENYGDLTKIGSVRSCRDYYIDFAMAFDAIYCHFGQAIYAVPKLDSEEVNNLSGLEGVGDTVYYRTTDRKSPHNAYASAEGIDAGIAQLEYRRNYNDGFTSQFTFNEDDETEINLSGASATYIQPGYVINQPWFEYNKKEKVYYRFQYGAAQVEGETNEPLSYKNVILQYCSWSNYDENGYLDIDTVSGGAGKYITNGKVIDITWSKDSEYGPTKIVDGNGNPIVLNQGKTWICIIQDSYADNVNVSDKLLPATE